jgi:membrane fusion protein (multidrug efflux system)
MHLIMRRLPITVLIASILAGACSSKKENKKEASPGADRSRNMPVKVEGFVVRPSSISNHIEVPGSLLPFESTTLYPEVPGRVTILNIREGAYVSKGTLLVKLFDGDLQAQLQKLVVQLQIKEKTAQRQAELLKISGISQQEYDLSALDVSNNKADIALIKTSIAKTEVRAPYNGRLGLRNISLGAYVTPSTAITTISQVDKLKLEFTVPEVYSNQIAVGQQVNFTTTGSTKQFAARVTATEASVTADTRSLRIRAVVTGNDKQLTAGAFAKVNFDFGEDKNALLIPSQAVIPQARYKNVIVYRGGIAKFEKVTTGLRDSTFVQITSGLQAGDTIVTTGLLTVKPEGKVELSSIKQ